MSSPDLPAATPGSAGALQIELPLSLVVNGERVQTRARPAETLLELLRERLGLTGAKAGCREGECGACTVILSESPFGGEGPPGGMRTVNACLTLALTCADARVTTIEGLATGAVLDPVQDAFLQKWAVQCGFCTPGMVLQAHAILNQHSDPSADQIRRGLEGNLCRCTGYEKIVEAVQEAARKRREVAP